MTKTCDNIIIAGAGDSLTKIDYSRIPKNYDVFRLNNFYFEDKYFLGRKVDFYLTNAHFMKNQYFNLYHLNKWEEYEIKTIMSTGHHKEFPMVLSSEDLVKKIPIFNEFMNFNYTYYKKMVSAGILAIFSAIAMGYKNIYIVGLDLYNSSAPVYPWKLGKNYCKIFPRDNSPEKVRDIVGCYHPDKLQIEALKLIEDYLEKIGGKIYSISLSSPINEFIEVAPIVNDAEFFVEIKKETALRDWLELPKTTSMPVVKKRKFSLKKKMLLLLKNSLS